MNPEEDLTELNINSAVSTLMKELPKPVQDFLAGPERDRISNELSQKHRLHVDQAGEFERAYLFMLLGIMSPNEFVSTLTEAGIAPEAVSALAADVNEMVFIPLRKKERDPRSAMPAAAIPQKPAPLPPPAIEYKPAPVTLPGSDVPAPMPAMSQTPQHLAAVPVVAPAPIVPEQHFVQSMPGAGVHQPGWHPAAAVHIYVPAHAAPQQQAAYVPSAPMPEPAAAPLPAPAPVYIPPAPPAPAPQPVTIMPSAVSIPIKKEFGADPYREPIA